MANHWNELKEFELSKKNLERLLNNEIPAIRIRGFATDSECASFTAAMKKANIKTYGKAAVGYIGMAQVEYRWDKTKEDYFSDVKDAFEDQKFVFDNSFDPMQRLIDRLSECWDEQVGIAEETGFGKYFAGIIRFASKGIALHADYAPFNSPGYEIEKINSQLGWNLFVEVPSGGGVTTVHNSPWNPEMEDGKPPQSYGLDRSVVEGAETFDYSPGKGDVVLFNSRNPHEISPGVDGSSGERLQIGSFIGRMSDTNKLVLWA
ncbi:hypothetical protein [Marinobacter algicola]|uniref:2OG-Fe(II)-dependent halogenase WelO5 family protein n=1 Tax=Marinobacter algicola TaxID=236100 RepID=UPI003BAAA5DE